MRPLSRARLLTLATTVLIVLVACNPQLLPLVPVLDAVGLDVLLLLLGVQLVALAPWLRAHVSAVLRLAGLVPERLLQVLQGATCVQVGRSSGTLATGVGGCWRCGLRHTDRMTQAETDGSLRLRAK